MNTVVDAGASFLRSKDGLDGIGEEVIQQLYRYVEANEYVLRRDVALAWNNGIRYAAPPWNKDETLAFCARAESGDATLTEMTEHL